MYLLFQVLRYLGMSALCPKECVFTYGNEKEVSKFIPSPTGGTVHNESAIGKSVNTTNICEYI